MAVELIKDLLKIDQTVGKDQIQALVEGEISLPEIKPSISKILTVDGDVEITGTKIVPDKIIVSGIVNFKALYSADDESQSVHSIDASTDFREEIDIESIDEQMSVDVKANIEHIDFSQVNEKRISVKAVLDLDGKVLSDNSIDIVKDIKGIEGLQVKKESIKYNDIIGTNNSSTLVKEAFELDEEMPDVVDVLRVDVKAFERETKVVDDKVIVAGSVICSIMYFGDDEENKINYLNHEMPFTHFVEIPGTVKDMNCGLKLHCNNANYDIREDINGNTRILDIEAMVRIDAKVYEQREKEVTVDTYSTKKKFDVKKREVVVSESIGESFSKEAVKGIIDLSKVNSSVKNIFNLNAKPIVTDYRIIEGKVSIEGLLDTNILYTEEDSQEIKSVRQEIPYKSYVDVEGIEDGMEVEVENILDNLDYRKTNNKEIEVDAIIKNLVSVNRIKKINIITEAVESDEVIDKKSRPSIIIYVVQKDDTIWDIAKRYNTTVQEIVETNGIVSPENIMPGEKIIIEKDVSL